MPTPATIAITPGVGQLLDAVGLTVGGNSVVRETMVIADPTSPTQLVGVTVGGAMQVDASATTQPVSIVGTVPISGTITVNIGSTGGLALNSTLTSGNILAQPYDGTNTIFTAAHPGFIQGTVVEATLDGCITANKLAVSLLSTTVTGTVAVTESGNWNINQALGVAGFEKITDGTNTAAVKAASVAATATDPALVVTTNSSVTAGTCVNTAVTSVSSAVVAANIARREVMITNTDTVAVYIGFGQAPTATAYHIVLRPCTVAHDGSGGTFVTDMFKGAINAITASTGGHLAIVELT